MELGVDHLDAAQPGPRLDVDRNTASLVGDEDRPALFQGDGDATPEPGQRLVDAVRTVFPALAEVSAATDDGMEILSMVTQTAYRHTRTGFRQECSCPAAFIPRYSWEHSHDDVRCSYGD